LACPTNDAADTPRGQEARGTQTDRATPPARAAGPSLPLSQAEIAHELCNLFAAIVSQAELLAEQARSSGLTARARAVLRAAELGGRIARSLVAGHQSPEEPAATDVGQVMTDVASLAGPALGPGVSLRRSLPAFLPPAAVARDVLHQALLNLVLNAAEAMEGQGTLSVRASAASTGAGVRIEVQVADTGPGLPAKLAGAVFDPFVSSKAHGRGLGLAIVKRLIEAAGGEVRVLSSPGAGTAFTLVLPVAPRAATTAALARPASPRQATGRTVLLVEDDPAVLAGLSQLLARYGFEVVEARSAREALEMAEREGIHVVVQDLGIPDMDGLELLSRLAGRLPRVKLLAVTGLPEDGVYRAAARYGASVLAKPFSGRELAATIDELLKAA